MQAVVGEAAGSDGLEPGSVSRDGVRVASRVTVQIGRGHGREQGFEVLLSYTRTKTVRRPP
jgi:hypothetical protein